MKYTVIVTPAAEQDIASAFAYIHDRSPLNAERWIRDLYLAIHELENFAGYARAPESEYLEADLQHKLFKSHRILYSVDRQNSLIHIHYVRHGAQRPFGTRGDEIA